MTQSFSPPLGILDSHGATIAPGDVLAVRTPGNLFARLIRLGEHLDGKPSLDNHIVIAHHVDPAGVPWGIEGRPGGVGWADLTTYVADPATRSNAAQPKTPEQRQLVASKAETMLGTAYDWQAIFADTETCLTHPLDVPDLGALFARDWAHTGVPGHVVCSSLAAWLYEAAGLPHPDVDHERQCMPSDWTTWCEAKAWTWAMTR